MCKVFIGKYLEEDTGKYGLDLYVTLAMCQKPIESMTPRFIQAAAVLFYTSCCSATRRYFPSSLMD